MRSPATLGTDMPMAWEEGLDEAVVLLRERDDMGRLGSAAPPAETKGLPFGNRFVASALGTVGGLTILVAIAAAIVIRRRTCQAASGAGS
jgi:hypothetical protein